MPSVVSESSRLDRADGEALPGVCDMAVLPAFVDSAQAESLFDHCTASLRWQAETIRMFGREQPLPRLTASHGEPGATYRYSGLICDPAPWTPPLASLVRSLAAAVGCNFNLVLANLYRDGRDSVGWHSDDERDLGPHPMIASLSLGATRVFKVRERNGSTRATRALHSGDLLIMWGDSQRRYQHCVPKTRAIVGPRVNLTFRQVR